MTADIRSLGKSRHVFTNWAKTVSCQPELYFEPTTVEEMQQILASAREKGKKVRVVGCGHSPSDLCCTTDYLISLRRYNKLVSVNMETCMVTVQGGCQLTDLNQKILPEHGLSLSLQGSVAEITVAGAISTGTHGSGAVFGTFSDFVFGLDLLTADGELMHISRDTNLELLRAAAVSIGALGVIVSVTLKCERAFNLAQTQYPAPLKDVIENLDVHLKSSEHFKFTWFPYTDKVVCSHASRTRQVPNAKSSWFWDCLIGFHLLQVLLWISTFFPRLVPFINQLYFDWLYGRRLEKVDRSDRIFNFNCLFHQHVMEWSIPKEHMGVVLTDLSNWFSTSGFPAHFPVEVRFVRGDDIYLSPAYNRDSCYINIVMYRPFDKDVPIGEYWDAFQAIVAKVGGRPHWAKAHQYGFEDFEELYPRWGEFCRIREKLDPNGMFLNANLERVFHKSYGKA